MQMTSTGIHLFDCSVDRALTRLKCVVQYLIFVSNQLQGSSVKEDNVSFDV